MRAGETVIVCGASADRAQFEPFEWPEHSVVWVGVGCGFLDFLSNKKALPIPEALRIVVCMCACVRVWRGGE